MSGTSLIEITRASMYRTPDWEAEVKPVIKAHMDANPDEYPMAQEDLISTLWPDYDYLETASVRGVLITAARTTPNDIVGVMFQPGYRGSRPPTHTNDGKEGEPKFPQWAEKAREAGANVEFLKEKIKRRTFGPPKALTLNSDLDSKLGKVQLKSDTRLQLMETHRAVARSPVRTVAAMAATEAALGTEVNDKAIALDDFQSRLQQSEERVNQLLNSLTDTQSALGNSQNEARELRTLVAELQEQVQNLGGVPILYPSANATPSPRTSMTPRTTTRRQ